MTLIEDQSGAHIKKFTKPLLGINNHNYQKNQILDFDIKSLLSKKMKILRYYI
jgi:hypothetical protein